MDITRNEEDQKLIVNGNEVGWCYREVDGYYVFTPFKTAGFYDSFALRLIADYLDKINELKEI